MKRSLILLGLVCSLSTTFVLTSCNGGETSTSTTIVTDLPLDVRPMEVIYAKTPKSEELAAEYYENVISKVTANDKWDGDKLISLATFVSSSDGDTTKFLLNTKSGQEEIRIRYMGIDTPELHHPSKGAEAWGLAAKQFVEYTSIVGNNRRSNTINNRESFIDKILGQLFRLFVGLISECTS